MNIVDTLSRKVTADGIEYRYEYNITKTKVLLSDYGLNKEVQSYGIEVERRDVSDGKVINIEREIVKNISPQRHKVQALAKLLFDNVVSPVNFIEVIGENIDDYIIDYDEVFKDTSIG